MKMIGYPEVKRVTKSETNTKRNKTMSMKVKESCMAPGLYLIAMTNTRKRVEVQLEIKRGKRTVKKIVNHVQTRRKMRDLGITRIAIDQEDIAVLMKAVKLT